MKIEFISNVWIASLRNIENEKFLKEKNISAILNVSKDLSFLDSNYEYNNLIQGNIEKYRIIKMGEYLLSSTQFIYDKIKNSESILVLCKDGKTLSPYIMIAYLIRYASIDFEKAKEIDKVLESQNQ